MRLYKQILQVEEIKTKISFGSNSDLDSDILSGFYPLAEYPIGSFHIELDVEWEGAYERTTDTDWVLTHTLKEFYSFFIINGSLLNKFDLGHLSDEDFLKFFTKNIYSKMAVGQNILLPTVQMVPFAYKDWVLGCVLPLDGSADLKAGRGWYTTKEVDGYYENVHYKLPTFQTNGSDNELVCDRRSSNKLKYSDWLGGIYFSYQKFTKVNHKDYRGSVITTKTDETLLFSNRMFNMDTDYTFSFWARTEEPQLFRVIMGGVSFNVPIDTEWKRHSVSANSARSQYLQMRFAEGKIGQTIHIRDVQNEDGLAMTSYIPALGKYAKSRGPDIFKQITPTPDLYNDSEGGLFFHGRTNLLEPFMEATKVGQLYLHNNASDETLNGIQLVFTKHNVTINLVEDRYTIPFVVTTDTTVNFKLAVFYSSGLISVSLNGNIMFNDYRMFEPKGLEVLDFLKPNTVNTETFQGYIKECNYYDNKMSDNNINRLTFNN
jgi:hypothetical protein